MRQITDKIEEFIICVIIRPDLPVGFVGLGSLSRTKELDTIMEGARHDYGRS